MNAFTYFHHAHLTGRKPALLEFTHPTKRTPFAVCGINPQATLVVKDGQLFKDRQLVGSALDIFDYLDLARTTSFFPAWIGYFSYEFAGYFCAPSPLIPLSEGEGNGAMSNRKFPDAFFQLFDQGLVIDNGTIVHHDIIPGKMEPVNATFKPSTLTLPMSFENFSTVVKSIKERIRSGDVYQVNFSLPCSFTAHDDDMLAIYAAMRAHNNSPFMGIMHSDDWWLLSGSPERLFSYHDGLLTTRPIAGTKAREHDRALDDQQVAALATCLKENAEHAMLVDLMRNDLHQVCLPGTVKVDEDRSVEFYSHVMHLVSQISGRTTASIQQILSAIFPGGTITGAPKANVMRTIAELESSPRGPYTGSMGYVSAGFGCDFNILIRSIFKHQDQAIINAGAGIVIDSDELSEWQEILRKAQAVKDILEHKQECKPPRDIILGKPVANVSSMKPSHAKVIFYENHDSFSFNIVGALKSLGAEVVVSTDARAINFAHFSHVVIGPGPGNPENLPELAHVIDHAILHQLPILGICLGHQAIGHYFGARIKKLPMPIHGVPHAVFHYERGLFHGLASPLTFTRYHSLAIAEAPHEFVVDAYCDDDCIMAIRHQHLPIFGVQFHPESYLSHGGHLLLGNFLHNQW